MYCQWLPNYLLEPADVAMMYKTMRRVYPRVDVWAINFEGDPASELLLIGHLDEAAPPMELTAGRIAELEADRFAESCEGSLGRAIEGVAGQR